MSVSRYTVNADKTGVNLQYAQKKASTAMTEGTLLALDSAGRLEPATATDTFIKGIAVTRVASTDADYASTTTIAYDEPREGELFVMDVDNTATAGFVPGVIRTINNAGEVKAAALNGSTDRGTVRIHKILSATSAVVSFVTQTQTPTATS